VSARRSRPALAKATSGTLKLWVSLAATALALVGLGAPTDVAKAAFPGQNGKIAYVCAQSTDICLEDAQGLTRLSAISDNQSRPAWSADGTKLAYHATGSNGGIWVVNADGTNDHAVSFTGLELNGGHAEPAWSPNGTQLALLGVQRDDLPSGGYRERRGLWVVNASGGEPRFLGTDYSTDTAADASKHSEREPSWSPDGTTIAVAGTYGSGWLTVGFNPGIYLVDVITGAQTRITDGSGAVGNGAVEDYFPNWSPDGTRLVFERGGGDDTQGTYVVNRDGSGLRKIGLGAGPPVWAPDGSRIFVPDDTSGDLVSMQPDGTDKQVVPITGEGIYHFFDLQPCFSDCHPLFNPPPAPPNPLLPDIGPLPIDAGSVGPDVAGICGRAKFDWYNITQSRAPVRKGDKACVFLYSNRASIEWLDLAVAEGKPTSTTIAEAFRESLHDTEREQLHEHLKGLGLLVLDSVLPAYGGAFSHGFETAGGLGIYDLFSKLALGVGVQLGFLTKYWLIEAKGACESSFTKADKGRLEGWGQTIYNPSHLVHFVQDFGLTAPQVWKKHARTLRFDKFESFNVGLTCSSTGFVNYHSVRDTYKIFSNPTWVPAR
jgi:TolB protein